MTPAQVRDGLADLRRIRALVVRGSTVVQAWAVVGNPYSHRMLVRNAPEDPHVTRAAGLTWVDSTIGAFQCAT